MEEEETCANCKFSKGGEWPLACCRYPPQPRTYTDSENEVSSYVDFPSVWSDSWCGEWKAEEK